MDLILWRHAEAHVIKDGQTDLERALTAKGERQAQRLAQRPAADIEAFRQRRLDQRRRLGGQSRRPGQQVRYRGIGNHRAADAAEKSRQVDHGCRAG